MKLARPKKAVLAKVVRVLTLLKTVRRKPLERGVGVALDLRAIAHELESQPLQEWHALAAAQLKEHDSKRRRKT